jgi:hypothetical protein
VQFLQIPSGQQNILERHPVLLIAFLAHSNIER